MSLLGIGIITFRRLDHLRRAVACVLRHAWGDYYLVIAEDGGEDGALAWCEGVGLQVATGLNSGVCWNKNRALYYLQSNGCNPTSATTKRCAS